LAEDRPDHLRTGFDVRGVGEPAGVVGEASTVEEGAAQPNKDDSQVTEVGRKNLPADLFEIAGVAIEVVSVGVEVPNPGCGFGTFGKAAIEMAGLTEQFEGGRQFQGFAAADDVAAIEMTACTMRLEKLIAG